MTSRGLALSIAAGLLLPSAGALARSKKEVKPAAAPASAAMVATLTGTVVIKGRIKKVRKAFNPYADIYGGGAGLQAKKAEEPGHLCVYLDDDAGSDGSAAFAPEASMTFKGEPAGPGAPHAILDQRERQFTADLLPVLVGTSVAFTNQDKIFHNVFSYSQPQPFDLGRRAGGETRTVVFNKLPPRGIGVLKVSCEIHSNMRSTILVMRNSHWAVLPESGGTFTLADVPPGAYTLTGWHVSLAPSPVRVTLKAGETAQATLVMQGEE